MKWHIKDVGSSIVKKITHVAMDKRTITLVALAVVVLSGVLAMVVHAAGYPVDEYVDFASGTSGQPVSTTTIDAHGTLCTWTVGNGTSYQTFSTTNATSSPGSITVGGTTYPGTSTLDYEYNPNGTTTVQYLDCPINDANVSFGFDYTTNSTSTAALSIFGGVSASGADYVLSHYIGNAGTPPEMGISQGADLQSPIQLQDNKTYWVTGLYCSTCSYAGGGDHYLLVFDPSTWQLVGVSTVPVGFSGHGATNANDFLLGRDGSDASPGTGDWWFGNVIISASGTFPLVPTTIVANAPTVSPATGSYTNSVTVTASDLVPSSTILYCVDQTNTCTPTTVYSGSVNVTTPGTDYFRTLAEATGWTTSSVTSVSYAVSNFSGASFTGTPCVNGAYAKTTNCTLSVTAGKVLAVLAYTATSSTVPIKDNCGASGGSDVYTSGGSYSSLSDAWYTTIVGTTTASCTVTVNAAATVDIALIAQEITGANTASLIDGTAVFNEQYGPGTSTNAVTSGATTTVDNDDFILGGTVDTLGSDPAWTAGTGFTIGGCVPAADGVAMCMESYPQSTAGSASSTFTATSNGGDTMITTLLAIKAAPVVAPTILSFSASPSSIVDGSSSVLSWNVSNASSVSITATGFSFSTSTLVASTTVSPTSTTLYTLTATNPSGSSTTSTTVTVTLVCDSLTTDFCSTDYFIRGGVGDILGNSSSTDFSLRDSAQVLDLPLMTSTDFEINSGVISPIFKAVKPAYTQIHYQWREDNGAEANASSATGGVEDVPLTGLQQNTSIRVRMEITNAGGTIFSYSPQSFQLQYGVVSSTCASTISWTTVGGAGSVWGMYNSSNLHDGSSTTDIASSTGGVADANHTFITPNAGVKTTTSTVASISVPSDSFMDMEFDVDALASSTPNSTYCFRLTNLGSTSNFVYSEYPQATVASSQSLTLTLSTSTVSLPGLAPGVAVSATTTATVNVTGATSGYTLSIQRNSATSTIASGTIAFPDYTPPWGPSGSTCASGQGNGTTTPGSTFSFRVASSGTTANYCTFWWGTSDSSGTAIYSGVPTTTQIIVNSTSSQNGTTTVTILYSANAPLSQKATSYTGGVTITAIANP